MIRKPFRLLVAFAISLCQIAAIAADGPFRIVVIDDMSGPYSGNGGHGTVLATTMAAEDFDGSVLGRKIEVLSADHQSKPDVAAALARQFLDQQGVSVIGLANACPDLVLAIRAISSLRHMGVV